MRNFVKLLAIAITPVLFAGGAQAAKEKSLEELKKEYDGVMQKYYMNKVAPYENIFESGKEISKISGDIVKNKVMTADNYKDLNEAFKSLFGVGMYKVSLWHLVGKATEDHLLDAIAAAWAKSKDEKLVGKDKQEISFDYYTNISGKEVIVGAGTKKTVTTYADLKPLWDCFVNSVEMATVRRGDKVPDYLIKIFEKLEKIDFYTKFNDERKKNDSNAKKSKDDYDALVTQKELLEQQIAALEKTDSSAINNLTSALKSIA